MAIVDANQASAAGISAASATTPESAPSTAPDLSSYSKEQLSDMLKADSSGGSAAQEVAPPVTPEVKPEVTPEVKPEVNVPDKFKNPDGTINIPALIKSYGEAEKVVGRQLNVESQLKQLAEQNQTLQQKLEELSKPQEPQPEAIPDKSAEEIAAMTPEEFKAYNDKRIESKFQELIAQQELNQQINNSINEVAKMDGANELSPDIDKIIRSPAFVRHPEAPKMAYYAALGQKAPMLVTQARNMGYSEGYAKAKEEMLKGVDSGKASAPVEAGNLSEDQIRSMSREELGKLITRYE